MNKAFVKEADSTLDLCPRCGTPGEPVGSEILDRFLASADRQNFSPTGWFCPSPRCEVAYFDVAGRSVSADSLARPAYPKDPLAPLCECFGLSPDNIEQDLDDGVVTRTRAAVERAKSSQADCARLAAGGHSCVAQIQRYFMQRQQERKG